MASACDTCSAACCRETHVLPTGREVLRIAAATGLPLAACTELRGRERCEGEFRIVLAAPSPAGTERRYHRLELRRVPTPEADFMQRCIFLQTDGPAARCGIYPLRPGPCAAFPFERDGAGVRISRIVRIGRAYCPPGAWQPPAAGDETERVVQPLVRRDADRAVYDAVIDVWNARADAALQDGARFFRFLHEAYAAIERHAPELFEVGVPPARIRGAVDEALRDVAP
ncbi:MAG: YkgJ family cysteine cluster protein [Polyangia bacterium]